MRLALPVVLLVGVALWTATAQDAGKKNKAPKDKGPEPLRALLITGGCCHDYNMQKEILMTGISERANVTWDFVYEQFEGKEHEIGLYKNADWAVGYDVIVHNECYGAVMNDAFVESIVKAHTDNDVGVVVLHCSMHSYRAATTDAWRKLLGVSSFNHGKKSPIAVAKLGVSHPVIDGLPDGWTTPDGELYNVEKVWDTGTALAQGTIPTTEKPQVCIWVNEYEGCRTFGTTIGHHNETMVTPEYLDLVTRGFLWSCGKLNDDGTPAEGYGPKVKQ